MDVTTRFDPPVVADERTMLESWLDYHRATLRMKCSGLTDEQLRSRAVPPSSISLLGLVRHMTEVERGWFTRSLTGEGSDPIYYSETDPDGDFDHLDTHGVAEVFALWDAECARSREHAARADSLDVLAKHRRRSSDPPPSLRWIMVHMIEEYARHNGHADFLRERIDGQTGE